MRVPLDSTEHDTVRDWLLAKDDTPSAIIRTGIIDHIITQEMSHLLMDWFALLGRGTS